jgi:hypothetical protein
MQKFDNAARSENKSGRQLRAHSIPNDSPKTSNVNRKNTYTVRGQFLRPLPRIVSSYSLREHLFFGLR